MATNNQAAAILEKLTHTNVPSNDSINASLETTKAQLDQQNLNHYGQRTADDVKTVLTDAQTLLNEKNEGNLLQRFIYDCQLAADELRVKGAPVANQIAGEARQTVNSINPNVVTPALNEAEARGEDIVEALKSVTLTTVNSKEFRALLLNLIELLQSTMGRSLQRLSPERILEPLKRDVADNRQRTAEELLEETKQAARQVGNEARQMNYEAKAAGQSAINQASADAQSAGQSIQSRAPYGTVADDSAYAAQQIGSNASSAARQAYDRARQGRAEPWDERKRQEVVSRFGNLWQQLSNNPEFGRVLNQLFALFDTLQTRLVALKDYTAAYAVRTPNVQLPTLTRVDRLYLDMYDILAQWTGRDALDQFLGDVQVLLGHAQTDQEMQRLFRDVRIYITQSVNQPELLKSDAYTQQSVALLDRSVDLLSKWAYLDETDYVLNQADELIRAFTEDATAAKLRMDTQALARHLIINEHGQVDFRVTKDVLQSMRDVLLPMMLNQFNGVPLPRIEGVSGADTYMLDNITFPGYKLMPDLVKVTAKEKLSLDAHADPNASKVVAKIVLDVMNFEAVLNDLHFAFRHKGALGSISDMGRANVKIGGPASKIKVRWVVLSTPTSLRFQLRKVYVFIDHVKIKILQAKHSVLLPMITSVFKGTIKEQIEKAIAENLAHQLNKFSNTLNDVAHQTARNAQRMAERRLDQAEQAAQQLADRVERQAQEKLSSSGSGYTHTPTLVELRDTAMNKLDQNRSTLSVRAKQTASAVASTAQTVDANLPTGTTSTSGTGIAPLPTGATIATSGYAPLPTSTPTVVRTTTTVSSAPAPLDLTAEQWEAATKGQYERLENGEFVLRSGVTAEPVFFDELDSEPLLSTSERNLASDFNNASLKESDPLFSRPAALNQAL